MASVLQLILRSKKEGTGAKDTAKELGGLEKLAKKVTVAFLAMTAFKVIKNATLLAARVETLGVVTKTLGRTAGMSEREIRSLEQAIVDQGITLQGSRQAIAMMIQSNVDLAHATDLARLAQDTAVIANVNSSEAFQQLTYVLQTGNVRMARTLGLNVQFGKAQQELAESLGKTTAELTEQEIMQARTNAVMKAGERIAGTYEAAMETAGKQILSMDRMLEEMSLRFGELFLPALEKGVGLLYETSKAFLDAHDSSKEFARSQDILTSRGIDYNKILKEQGVAITDDWGYTDEYTLAIIKLAGAIEKEFYAALTLIPDEIHELSHEFRMLHPELFETGEKAKLLAENLDRVAIAKLFASDPAMAIQLWADKDALEAADAAARSLAAGLEWMFSQKGGGTIWEGIDPWAAAGGYVPPTTTAPPYALQEMQHGGPVQAGRPYIVGEREAEMFVPRQDGDIYNQQQLAGGDININTGMAQRAFNNMAEDWMRGLGG